MMSSFAKHNRGRRLLDTLICLDLLNVKGELLMDNEEKIRKEIGPVDKKVSLFSVEFLLSPWAIATLTFTIFISLILIGCSFVQDLQE